MNTQQAKFILQGYRPDGADAGDATFAEALEHARHDMVLREWFAREQAFDSAISAKLSQVQAPAGLREAILAGARLTAADTVERSWWRRPALLAVAAGVAVLFSATLALWPRQAVASQLIGFALTDAEHTENHGGHGNETGALQALLVQPTTRLGQKLPVDFASLRASGCRTLHFGGHDLLEVCFERNGVGFHCYIAQRADFPSIAMTSTPALIDRNGLSTAAWADAAHLYVLVSETGRPALEKLL